MEYKEYLEESSRTCPSLGSEKDDNNHMLMGMVTEVGELVDAYKKHYAYGKKLDLVNVAEEIGDLMWYLANFCRMNNIDLEEQMSVNIAKLRLRYPDKFDADKAINRDVVAEREVLEGKPVTQ